MFRLVQLDEADGVHRASVHTELAEDALVLVLRDDLGGTALGPGEDVHWAGRDALPAEGLAGAEGSVDL